MCKNSKKSWEIELEIIEHFKAIIQDTLKRCIGISHYPINGFDDFLLFKTYDDEMISIGCLDGQNLVLDSDFIYKRFLHHWDKWRKTHKEAAHLPSSKQLYKTLYKAEILSRGIFLKKPLYKFLMGTDKIYKKYFIIPQNFVDFEVSMIKWH